jgi:D-sedoheptulose 7-phosphate isomerase
MGPQRNGKGFIGQYLFQLANLLMECPVDRIMAVLDLLIWARERERKVFTFGNGGSAAAASHLTCDLSKGTIGGSHKRFKVICLSDNVPLMTAWANDAEYADIFAAQLDPLLDADDVLFAISASGNSPNVIRAIELGNTRKAHSIGLTGFAGGLLAQRAEVSVTVPSDNMQHVEDVHMMIIHLLTSFLRMKSHEREGFPCLDEKGLQHEIIR